MRDASYKLHPDRAAGAMPPFVYRLTSKWPFPGGWALLDGAGEKVGEARTRAGARAGLRALYANYPALLALLVAGAARGVGERAEAAP